MMMMWHAFVHRPIVNSMLVCLCGALVVMVVGRFFKWLEPEDR